MIGAGVNSDLLVFTRQFTAMVRSNLQLVHALESLARETPRRRLRLALTDVLAKVRAGRDFDRALADHPKIFNPTYVGVVRAGMQSGQLGEALQQVSEYLTSLDRVMTKIRGAMMYPLLLLVSFMGTFHMMVFGILPRFETLFGQYGHALPAPTQFVLAIGHVYAAIWPELLASTVAVILGFGWWIATPNGRLTYDRLKLQIPIVGPLWRLAALARFAHTLGIQVQNSVTLLESIRVAAPACNNKHVEVSLRTIATDIERGEGITQAFVKQDLFRGVVQQMISAGEKSGELTEPLKSAATYFESLWIQRLDAVVGLINPALTAIMGLLIAGMLVAAFLPVFEVSGIAMP
jgi:type II secretory pathway component PulF